MKDMKTMKLWIVRNVSWLNREHVFYNTKESQDSLYVD